jgi:hypothetical protein
VNLLANTWRQLVRRRLWPVAVLLVAALAAVPVMLAKDPEPVALPPDPVPAESVKTDATLGDPIVAKVAAEDRDRRRRVLGARKDPFAPTGRSCTPCPDEDAGGDSGSQESGGESAGGGATATPETAPVPSGAGDVPASPPASGLPDTAPAPTTPPVAETPEAPKKTYPADSVIVRFGEPESMTRSLVEKLEALPAESEATEEPPLLAYLGLTRDDKKAIFLVDASAATEGDGSCKPDPTSCETVHLRKGDTQFFDVKDETGTVVAQYQLDIVDIKPGKKKAASAKDAKRSLARATRAGRRTLGVSGTAVQVEAGF